LGNTITHGLGLVLSLVGAVLLAAKVLPSGNMLLIVGCGIYTLSLIMVYAVSTLSHAIKNREWRYRWRIWDQGLIYLLIAGSYTGFALPALQIRFNRYVLAGVWTLALAGFVWRTFIRFRTDRTIVLSYIALGWLPIFTFQSGFSLLPEPALDWLVVGGFFYTAGVGFLVLDQRVPYFHVVWHLMVIAGSGCHFIGIYQVAESMLAGGTTSG
jgi:hemolysin III